MVKTYLLEKGHDGKLWYLWLGTNEKPKTDCLRCADIKECTDQIKKDENV